MRFKSRSPELPASTSSVCPLGETNSEHFHDAELHRIRGHARLQCGAHERTHGRDDLLRAVAIARQQEAVSFEIRSIVSLLTLVPDVSDRRSWLDDLQTAVGRLESSEAGVDEREAWALVASMGGPSLTRGETSAGAER